MSGGLRTSVKGYLIAQRLNLATDPLSENVTISNNVTAPLDPPPQLVEEMTMDTGTDGLGICDGNIPCFPMLNSGKSMASFMTRTRAESPPPQGNSNSKVSSVSVPSTPRTEGEVLMSSNLKNFFFNELKTATRNFRPDSLVGEGGFGCVFKGWVDVNALTTAKPGTGMVIAVKRLNQDGLQGHKEWLAEINYLGQLRHPNLVKLVGYCLEDDHRLLVYEFMPRGSLDNHLFRRASYIQPLSWSLRMKIALGAAKGLAFLHSDEAKVIYRDFKTSNILLDSAYNAKLSDFGFAKDRPAGDRSHVTTLVITGYAAPEYMTTGHLTAKSDVYSFGVVMLEMLSGRRAVDKNRPTGEHNLVEWAKPYLASRLRVLQVFDARIDGQYSVAAALKAVNLAIRCLATEPKFRPIMSDVVKSLEQLQEPEDMEGPGPSQNEPRQNPHASSSNGSQKQRRSMNGTSSSARNASLHRTAASRGNT